MTPWPHQQRGHDEAVRLIDAGHKRICLTSPTGGGKSLIAGMLMETARVRGWKTALYTNRRMLTDQLIDMLTRYGISFGVRAAGFDEHYRPGESIQICSTQTADARKLKKRDAAIRNGMDADDAQRFWQLHDADLCIVDEIHLQKGAVLQRIVDEHLGHHDAAAVMFTATPLGVSFIADDLVVAGTPSELRKCGALVPATIYAPDELDTKKLENKSGDDFSYNDIKKIWTTAIFGRVFDHWQILNPSQRPAVGFAPGVKESIWFVDEFAKRGVECAHIDGEDVYYQGEFYKSNREMRALMVNRLKRGEVKILWNRFVCREGVDFPWLYHVILATPFGSLTSYLQTCGRVLRYSPETPDSAIIQDHGGNFWRHGSPNVDRDWGLYFDLPQRVATRHREERLREKEEPEPIVCPECKMVRAKGAECPQCGFRSTGKRRMVLQSNGKLKEMTGDIFRQRRVRQDAGTQGRWRKMYHRAKNSKNRMTFTQAYGYYFYENRYWPPKTLPLMPANELDWFLPVADVAREDLT